MCVFIYIKIDMYIKTVIYYYINTFYISVCSVQSKIWIGIWEDTKWFIITYIYSFLKMHSFLYINQQQENGRKKKNKREKIKTYTSLKNWLEKWNCKFLTNKEKNKNHFCNNRVWLESREWVFFRISYLSIVHQTI